MSTICINLAREPAYHCYYMIYETIKFLCRYSPALNRFLQRALYQYLAKLGDDGDLLFMNFGYLDSNPSHSTLPLDQADEPQRSFIQLYHQTVCTVDIQAKNVLEVGCGHGGGASYMMRYFQPRSIVGIDFAPKAIEFCNRWHSIQGLRFIHGDAHLLPFNNETFDAVVNVESSHRYNSMELFLSEVHRVLRPHGHLLFTDFRPKREVGTLQDHFRRSGMQLLEEEIITPNILYALNVNHDYKVKLVRKHTPRLLQKSLLQLWAAKGSKPYEWFWTGKWEYLRCVLRKEVA